LNFRGSFEGHDDSRSDGGLGGSASRADDTTVDTLPIMKLLKLTVHVLLLLLEFVVRLTHVVKLYLVTLITNLLFLLEA
jgi:hypothetical protein